MAGHIQDRWFKTETSTNDKPQRVKTTRHGTGKRYRARYIAPDGTEKSKSFPDGQKRLAEKWLATRGGDPNTRASMTSQFRLHVFPHIGTRPCRRSSQRTSANSWQPWQRRGFAGRMRG